MVRSPARPRHLIHTESLSFACTQMNYRTKQLLVRSFHLVTWPLAQPASIFHKWRGSGVLFDFSAKLLSLLPGKFGQYIRASFYMQTLGACHPDLAVAFGSFFSHPTARVGRSVTIGSFCIIGTVELGDRIQIASRVSILSGRHQHGDSRKRSISDEGHYQMVSIGEGCWIGEGAIVMASLGKDCIVGAGSVVTKPVADGLVVAGNPAAAIVRGEVSR